jgi:hypothetical protein
VDDQEHVVLKVRDASDGKLVLTLRPPLGRTTELTVAPWVDLKLIEN